MLSPSRPAVGFIFVTMVLSVLGFGLLIPVLPELVKEFNAGDSSRTAHAYGALVGAFALLQFIGSSVLGALSDRFGRRKVILIALAGASIDYVIMALAPTLGWLFLARCISGFTSGVVAAANAYVADVTPPEKRAQAFGLIGAGFGLGLVIGPLAGGFFGSIDLRLPFWFAAGCSTLNFLYGAFVLPESLRPENRRPFSWQRANPIGAFRALKRLPAVRGLADSYFILMFAQAMLFSIWVLYTTHRYHWNTREVGVSLGLAGVLSALVQALLVKKIVARFGDRRAMLLGFSISIASHLGYGLATASWVVYAIIILGALTGVTGPSVQSYITRHVPADEQGAVQGVFAGLMSLASIPGPLLGTWSFGWAVTPGQPEWLAGTPFFISALLMACALGLTLRTFRKTGA